VQQFVFMALLTLVSDYRTPYLPASFDTLRLFCSVSRL
jgi:hypothetical protein